MVSATRRMIVQKRNKSKGGDVSQSEHHSVSVRKIDNGFVVSKSKSCGDDYSCTEEYHPKRPKIDIQSVPSVMSSSGKSNANALRTASGNKKVSST